MRIAQVLFSSMFLAGFAIGVFGQNETNTQPKAYKFTEFGKMSQSGVKEKVDGLLRELAKNRSAQGYIINYGTPKAIAARRKQITNSFTFTHLDLRMTFVDGGFEKNVRTVMWIVPPGATPPTP